MATEANLAPGGQWSVICHDYRSAISSTLETYDDRGCELRSLTSTAEAVFPKRSQVLINLLDPVSGASVNVQAKVVAFARKQGRWHYRLKWEAVPELLAEGAAA